LIYTKAVNFIVVILLVALSYIACIPVRINKVYAWRIVRIEYICCIVLNLIKWEVFSSNLGELKNFPLSSSVVLVPTITILTK